MAVDISQLKAEIAAGKHDGDLGDIQMAMIYRMQRGEAGFRWVIELGGVRVTEDDITIREAKFVKKDSGFLAGSFDFRTIMADAELASAIVRARLITEGKTPEQALKQIDDLSYVEILDGVAVYEVNPDPKDGSESS